MSHRRTRPTRLAAGLAAVGTAAALSVAAPTTSSQAAPAAPAAAAPSAQDAAYLAFAARANLAEVAQGKLAKRLSDDEDVRDFGRDMVRDHRKQYRALEAVATSVGVALPKRPSKQQRQVVRAWSGLDGKAFDCAYVPFQWGDHQLVIAMTQMEVATGSDPSVKNAAAASLPVLQEHYEHVTMLVGDLGRC